MSKRLTIIISTTWVYCLSLKIQLESALMLIIIKEVLKSNYINALQRIYFQIIKFSYTQIQLSQLIIDKTISTNKFVIGYI